MKEEVIQNLNYFEQSVSNVYSITLATQEFPSLSFPYSSGTLSPGGVHDFMLLSNNEKSVVGTAIGRTVDGVAHVSSKVDVRLVYDQ